MLVGLACGFFLEARLPLALFVNAFGGVFSVTIWLTLRKFLAPYRLPTFTFPFNIVVIAIFLSTYQYANLRIFPTMHSTLPSVLPPSPFSLLTSRLTSQSLRAAEIKLCLRGALTSPCEQNEAMAGFFATVRGVAQIFIQDSLLAAVLVILGTAIASPTLAIIGIVGSGVGVAVGTSLGVDGALVGSGLWGYDAALTAMAVCFFLRVNAFAIVFAVLSAGSAAFAHGAILSMTSIWCVHHFSLIMQGLSNMHISLLFNCNDIFGRGGRVCRIALFDQWANGARGQFLLLGRFPPNSSPHLVYYSNCATRLRHFACGDVSVIRMLLCCCVCRRS